MVPGQYYPKNFFCLWTTNQGPGNKPPKKGNTLRFKEVFKPMVSSENGWALKAFSQPPKGTTYSFPKDQ